MYKDEPKILIKYIFITSGDFSITAMLIRSVKNANSDEMKRINKRTKGLFISVFLTINGSIKAGINSDMISKPKRLFANKSFKKPIMNASKIVWILENCNINIANNP